MMDTKDVQSFRNTLVNDALVRAADLGFRFDDDERIRKSLLEAIIFRHNDPCEMAVKALLQDIGVGFDREIRYRLERDFFHDVTGYILRKLEKNDQVKRTGLRGRRVPVVFYRLPETDYRELVGLMNRKVMLSNFISNYSSTAGYVAESLWELAFQDLGFEILGREVRRFRGKRAMVGGDIDFIAHKDGLIYGVEIKNSLSYPDDLSRKLRIAVQLGVIPLFVARWISKSQFYMVRKYGGLVKLYETSIYPSEYVKVIEECRRVLGFPVIALDRITERPKRHLSKIHSIALGEVDRIRLGNRRFLEENPWF